MENRKGDENVTELEIITLTCAEANQVSPSCDDDSDSSESSDYVSTSFIVENTEVVPADNRPKYFKDGALEGVGYGSHLESITNASHSPNANRNSPCLAELGCSTHYQFAISDEKELKFDTISPEAVVQSKYPVSTIAATRIHPESVIYGVKCASYLPTSVDCKNVTEEYDSVYHEDEFTVYHLNNRNEGKSNQEITVPFCSGKTIEKRQVGKQAVDETEIGIVAENRSCVLSGNMNTNLIKCDQNLSFKSSAITLLKGGIKVHTGINREEGIFVCEFCKERFFSKDRLRVHIMAHISKKMHKCKICGVRFANSSVLKRHMKKHKRKSSFTCPICKVKSESEQENELHIHSHRGEKLYHCNECYEGFVELSSLKFHLHRHERSINKPYKCRKCDKRFSTVARLRKHERAFVKKYYPCPTCEKTFEESNSLNIHLETHAIVRDPLTKKMIGYTCKICNKVLKKKTWYKQHLKFHTKCKFCQQNFEDSVTLQTHVASAHRRETRFLCDICGKGFKYRYTLAAHKRVHNRESPHVCEYCGKVFALGPDLVEHTRTHTNEKPYACDFCSKKFARRGALRMHLKPNGDPRELYICNICQKSIPPRCFREHLMNHDLEEFCVITIADNAPSENDTGIIVPVQEPHET